MISIVLPAYNEEKNIGRMIKNVSNFFVAQSLPYEIIVADDGSKDKTLEVLGAIENLNLKIVVHEKNLGYGAALRSGFAKAKGEMIFFTDSDCQFDISDLKIFLEEIKENDFVIGYRKNRQDPFIRKAYAQAFRVMCRVFFGVKVKDVDCAFKLYKNYVLQDLDLYSDGALINLEILAKIKKRKYIFAELPVNHFKRTEGRQTGGSFKVIFKAIGQFFILWKKINIV
jgi:glycosyltransferase involved in cell wall biosynthesis